MLENNEETEGTVVLPIEELDTPDYEYKGLKLRNGMQVLLVRHPTLHECEVALNVRIGSSHDPCYIQGLAHLLEHVIGRNMLLISQNEFANTLYRYGGTVNAKTFTENTTYSFKARNISNRLLKLFADFIFEPDFDPSVIEGEVKAIDSEHIITSTFDEWKLREFVYAHWRMSDLTYPVFDVGNMSTLSENIIHSGLEIETELREFHNQFYSANVMSLCIVTRDSLNSLKTTVENIFSNKPNRNIEIIPISSTAYILPQLTDDYKTGWFIVPTLSKKILYIFFPLPRHYVDYRTGSANYICWMLKDRRQGSLLAALKDRSWCTFIDCHHKYDTIEETTGKIRLQLTLTQQGLDHIDDIIKLIFQYLRLLYEAKRDGYYYIFGENYFIPGKFKFEDVAKEISIYSLSYVLKHCTINCTVFPQDEVDEILENYVVPEYIIYCVMAKENKNITNEITLWRQTKYMRHEILDEQILYWHRKNIGKNITINKRKEELRICRNNVLEWNLTSVERNDITSNTDDIPIKIYQRDFLRIWRSISKQRQNFEMYFHFYRTCSVDKDTEKNNYRNCNLNSMFVRLIQEYMSDYLYSAEMVGITINLKSNIYGISLYIKNYEYKKELAEMVGNIIRDMIDVSFNESRFQMLKEQYITSLKEDMEAPPYLQTLYLLEIHLMKRLPYHELQKDANFISATDMKQYIEDFLKTMFIKCLICGNLTNDELVLMCAYLVTSLKKLSPRRYLKTEQLLDIKLEKGSYKHIDTYNSSHKSSCTTIYYQVGSSLLTSEGIYRFAFLRIIQVIITGHCLEYLRFKKNLGYGVSMEILQMYDTFGLAISVMGNNFDTMYVETEIDKFMEEALEIVRTIPKNEFKQYKRSARYVGRKNVLKIGMAGDFYGYNDYWHEIASRNYNFPRSMEELMYIQRATRKHIHTFFKEMLDKESQRKLSIHVLHPRNLPTNEEARQNIGNN